MWGDMKQQVGQRAGWGEGWVGQNKNQKMRGDTSDASACPWELLVPPCPASYQNKMTRELAHDQKAVWIKTLVRDKKAYWPLLTSVVISDGWVTLEPLDVWEVEVKHQIKSVMTVFITVINPRCALHPCPVLKSHLKPLLNNFIHNSLITD